ncbi:MFS transporter [Halobacillus aidingensis]|uniref:Predicted arabinose efflux permease, MFS family n=1 Tax=Halobacillus aidingensis TaxID=240303 RepID=A0A1H0RXY9_HALAD|nr:MFS transporter [Halobacillus aidingensis]SDP34199.1 Predicted arabinose efflux permease, MFS family [Halobacillus aidingensis]
MERQPRLWTSSFLNVCASNFLVFLVFYLLFVTMPIYTIESIGVAEGEAGLIITVFLLAAILIRPLSGQWVESFGRKPVVVTALSIFLGSSFLYLWFDAFSALLIVRFIQGIGFGMGTTALGAIAADVVPDQRKGEGLGYFAMSMNFAMVIGPFLGLTLIQNAGFTVMFYVCAALAVMALLTGLVIRVDPLAEPAKKSLVPSMHNLLEKPVIPIALTGAVMALAYAGVLSFVSVYATQLGLAEAASYFFVVYALVLLISRPFTGRWFDQYGENVIVIPSILIFGAGMLILSFANTAFVLLLAGGLIGLGWGTLVPSMQTIALKKVPERAGSATATFFTIFDIGIGVGSYVVGAIATGIGFSSLYFNSSFVVFGAVGLYILLHGRKVRSNAEHRVEYSS